MKRSKDTPKQTRIAYGYCRVSTAEQCDGQSLDLQRRQIEALATLHGYTLAGMFVDGGVSGSKPLRERPEGRKLWKTMRPGDAVIAKSLDRAFRDQLDALDTLKDCRKSNISLVLGDLGGDVTEDGVGALIFGVMGAVAAFERHRIVERIRDAKQAQAARGEYLGGTAPFGYQIVDRGGVRVVEPDKALQERVLDLRHREYSTRMISAELRVKDGVEVSAVTVAKFLRGHSTAKAA